MRRRFFRRQNMIEANVSPDPVEAPEQKEDVGMALEDYPVDLTPADIARADRSMVERRRRSKIGEHPERWERHKSAGPKQPTGRN